MSRTPPVMPVRALWHIEERTVPIMDMMHAYIFEGQEPMKLNVRSERQVWLVWRDFGSWPTVEQVLDAIDEALQRGYREDHIYLMNTKLRATKLFGVAVT